MGPMIEVKPGLWVNPDQVAAVYTYRYTYSSIPDEWEVRLRLSNDLDRRWLFDTEEDAYREAERLVDLLSQREHRYSPETVEDLR